MMSIPSPRHARHALCVVVVAIAFAGCSFSTGASPASTAEKLIEAELGEQVGMTFSEAECADPENTDVGTGFDCTATNAAGEAVTFASVIDPDDMVFVAPSNIITADEMAAVEEEAAAVLSDEVGATIAATDVECPTESTVLGDNTMRCEINDAASGDRYELTVTFGEFELREGFGDRFYEVGELLS